MAAIINDAREKPTKVQLVKALAFMLNNNFTRAQYESVQSQSKVEGADICSSSMGLMVVDLITELCNQIQWEISLNAKP